MAASVKLVTLFVFIANANSCTFPSRFQGRYLVQARPNFRDDVISMSEILIEENEIKPWGYCHGIYGSQFIINKRTGNKDCLRCFDLIPRSAIVLQVVTQKIDYCYADYKSANLSCQNAVMYGIQYEAMFLYRENQAEAFTNGTNILCPIIGHYKMTYSSDEHRYRCNDHKSTMDNCLESGHLRFKFRKCNFPDFDLTYKCLGLWKSHENQNYLALMEVDNVNSEKGRSFRCGMYYRDNNNGYIYLAISASSSCTDQLYSSKIGYETMIFTPEQKPNISFEKESSCKFPSWSLGKWENLQINPQTLFYDIEDGMQTITCYCVGKDSQFRLGIYLIRTVDQCGKEAYKCIWLVRRSMNIIEYQLGKKSSQHPRSSLCALDQFERKWKTKAKIKSDRKSTCPLFGHYRGMVPNTDNICAQLTTQCNKTEIIRYQVNSCKIPEEVYEDQEYRCHGSWEEGGFLYTYTTLKDSKEKQQCFVGRISKYGKEIIIAELGDNCYRKDEPLQTGMKMFRQASCPRKTNINGASTLISSSFCWLRVVLVIICFRVMTGEN